MTDPDTGARYLRTGDLGFLREEGLYITGRRKELMIVRGRNIYPYDIEQTIADSHATFQKGGCAVVAMAHEESGASGQLSPAVPPGRGCRGDSGDGDAEPHILRVEGSGKSSISITPGRTSNADFKLRSPNGSYCSRHTRH